MDMLQCTVDRIQIGFDLFYFLRCQFSSVTQKTFKFQLIIGINIFFQVFQRNTEINTQNNRIQNHDLLQRIIAIARFRIDISRYQDAELFVIPQGLHIDIPDFSNFADGQ